MTLGALRDAFFEEGWTVVCSLCGCWALASDCRDCRSVDADLSRVCGLCRDEMCAEEDATLGNAPCCRGLGCRECL